MAISVRHAADDDMTSVESLRRAWNEETTGESIDDPAFGDRFAAWWARERTTRTFFLVEVDGTVVGMANVKRYERMPVAGRPSAGRWGYVGNVFVLPDHRGGGVGHALMQALIAWAADVGFEHLRLAPSPLSKSFYARLGFTPGAIVELDPPAP